MYGPHHSYGQDRFKRAMNETSGQVRNTNRVRAHGLEVFPKEWTLDLPAKLRQKPAKRTIIEQ